MKSASLSSPKPCLITLAEDESKNVPKRRKEEEIAPISVKRVKATRSMDVIDLDDDHCVSSETNCDIVLSYPPDEKDTITIYKQDLSCLNEGEFLNDSILGFYLK